MQTIEQLKQEFRNQVKSLGLSASFTKHGATLRIKEGTNEYKTSGFVSGDVLYLTGSLYAGRLASARVISLHLNFWFRFANLLALPIILLDRTCEMSKPSHSNGSLAGEHGFLFDLRPLHGQHFVCYYIPGDISTCFFKLTDDIEAWMISFIEKNPDADIPKEKIRMLLPQEMHLRWHGSLGSVDFSFESTLFSCVLSLDNADSFSGAPVDATFVLDKMINKFKSKTRLKNLMEPTYVNLQYFLKSIEPYFNRDSAIESAFINHFKDLGYTDERLEQIAIIHNRSPKVKKTDAASLMFRPLFSSYVFFSSFFAFGDVYVHISRARHDMNVTVLTSDSFDGIKEKMKAHLHALTSLEFEQVKEPF